MNFRTTTAQVEKSNRNDNNAGSTQEELGGLGLSLCKKDNEMGAAQPAAVTNPSIHLVPEAYAAAARHTR